jgi:hypothetical protein
MESHDLIHTGICFTYKEARKIQSHTLSACTSEIFLLGTFQYLRRSKPLSYHSVNKLIRY